MNVTSVKTIWTCVAALLPVVLTLTAAPLAAAPPDGVEALRAHASTSVKRAIRRGHKRFAFDVSENGTRFVFDELPIDEAGFPLYGNPFITQGFIYPSGTLDPGDPNRDGVIPVLDDEGEIVGAEPEFPDKLLGIWICEGKVFAQEGFNIESGPTVITTQLYDFNAVSGRFGRISLTSNGLELIDLNVPIERAVIGGTGPFRQARGQVAQTFRGVNEVGGFILRFVSELR